MYIGEQIINPTTDRLKLSLQLGVEHVVIDTRPNLQLLNDAGGWDGEKVAAQRRSIEALGLTLEVLALDVGSILLDSLYQPDKARATAERLRNDIRAAAAGGVTTLKYNVQMVGITRTGFEDGRGGVKCSAFRLQDYSPHNDERFSYWGVGHPGGGHGADIAVNAFGTPGAAGQVLGTQAGQVSEQD
ncbi:MAG: mannonate dehydratase, partial [Rhizobiales bacterium]|nr:mannonate dehydratase [Hyphomicrobiales bacterium]